jgi:glycosyltransferase involved in cell wall biosynthesis
MNTGIIVAIIPFYNRRHTILASLASVLSQTIRPDQLILVNDGSTDGGGDLVAEWMARAGRMQPCRLAHQSNLGAAAARNYGLSLAMATDYVAFLDSDDVWPSDFLERTQAALSPRDDAIAATCDRKFFYSDGRPTKINDCSLLAKSPALWMMEYGAGIASATLFRRDAIDRRGGFPAQATGEDAALFLPLCLDGSWLHVPGEPVIFQRGVAQQLGDEENLSEKIPDGKFAWAQIYEQFFVHDEGHVFLNNPECRRLLAKAWHLAGKQLCRRCAPRKALTCFWKSWGWNPWRVKCYVWMLRSLLAMQVRRSTPAYSTGQATEVSL